MSCSSKTETSTSSPTLYFEISIFPLNSFINLNAYVIHPIALNILTRLDRNILDYISTEEMFNVDPSGNLIKDPDGVTGISEFMKAFPDVKFRGGTEDRNEFIKLIKKKHNVDITVDKKTI